MGSACGRGNGPQELDTIIVHLKPENLGDEFSKDTVKFKFKIQMNHKTSDLKKGQCGYSKETVTN